MFDLHTGVCVCVCMCQPAIYPVCITHNSNSQEYITYILHKYKDRHTCAHTHTHIYLVYILSIQSRNVFSVVLITIVIPVSHLTKCKHSVQEAAKKLILKINFQFIIAP